MLGISYLISQNEQIFDIIRYATNLPLTFVYLGIKGIISADNKLAPMEGTTQSISVWRYLADFCVTYSTLKPCCSSWASSVRSFHLTLKTAYRTRLRALHDCPSRLVVWVLQCYLLQMHAPKTLVESQEKAQSSVWIWPFNIRGIIGG